MEVPEGATELVCVSVEHKSIMTAHGKARKNGKTFGLRTAFGSRFTISAEFTRRSASRQRAMEAGVADRAWPLQNLRSY
jgi:hypothetical protein